MLVQEVVVPTVVVSCDGRLLSRHPLTQEQTHIGRRAGNEIVLDRWSVSGSHALLIRDGPNVEIQDLGSRNGTYVDGARIARATLSEQSLVKIADFTLTLVAQRAAPSYEPTMVVRSAPSATPAKLCAVDRPAADIALSRVVTAVGGGSGGRVTCIRRADDFAVASSGEPGCASLNGAALGTDPVRLQDGDVLQVNGDRWIFRLAALPA